MKNYRETVHIFPVSLPCTHAPITGLRCTFLSSRTGDGSTFFAVTYGIDWDSQKRNLSLLKLLNNRSRVVFWKPENNHL